MAGTRSCRTQLAREGLTLETIQALTVFAVLLSAWLARPKGGRR